MHKLVNAVVTVTLGMIVGAAVVVSVLYVFIRALEFSLLGGK